MYFKVTLFYSCFFFLHCSNAFNITSILGQYPSFSTFNKYLSQTQLAKEINSRQNITVFVVSNDAISPLSGKPQDVLEKLMSVHVVLDYYDEKKLQNLSNKTAQLTTLLQSSGQARGQEGFLKATVLTTGTVVIGSAVQGKTLGANLVKSVSAEPYNISVLQISTTIVPVGIDDNLNSTSPAGSPNPGPGPQHSPQKSPSPAPSPKLVPKPSPNAGPSPSQVSAPTPSGVDVLPPEPSSTPTADEPPSGSNNGGENLALRVGLGVVITIVISTFHLIVKE